MTDFKILFNPEDIDGYSGLAKIKKEIDSSSVSQDESLIKFAESISKIFDSKSEKDLIEN